MQEYSRVSIEVGEHFDGEGTLNVSKSENGTVGYVDIGSNLAGALHCWGRPILALAQAAVEVGEDDGEDGASSEFGSRYVAANAAEAAFTKAAQAVVDAWKEFDKAV